MPKFDKNSLTSAGLFLALFLLLVICYISYTSIHQSTASSRWVSHTYTVINQINSVLSRISDAETAQRGYLLTGDKSHLKLYSLASAQLPQQLAILNNLMKDNVSQQNEVVKLEGMTAERMQVMQEVLDRMNGQIPVSTVGELAQVKELIVRGKVVMDQIREQIQHMTDVEYGLLKQRAELEQADSTFARRWVLLGNTIAISLLLLTFWLIKKEIATRKSAQHQAEKIAQEIEDLYNNAPCAYHSVDKHGLITRMNTTALNWLGYSREEVVNKKLHPDLMTPESAERFHELTFPLFKRQGWLRDVEFDYMCKDGTVFNASLNATTVYDEQGDYLYSRSSFYNITDRKQAEMNIISLNTQLAQKAAELEMTNKELESFSYSVSHDLRSPLRAIDGYAHIFEEDFAHVLDEEGLRLLNVIRTNSKKMGRLIDDLLAFSRLGRKAVEAAEVDMNALVDGVWNELQSGGEHSNSVFLKQPLPAAWGDASLLKQVLQNLLSNAAKYSSKQAQPQIEVSASVEPTEIIYSIRDNGVGFDMKYYHKLFGVFQRLHRDEDFPGTGVGLAIVERVIVRHGGRVWADSVIDEGTTFSFSLPKKDLI